MYKYNKILVGLDNTDIDVDLINAVSKICELSGSRSVHFVNVIRDFNLPEELLKEFPQLLDNAIEERKEALEKKVNESFRYGEVSVSVSVIVKQGQVTKYLLKYAAQERVDLIVLGRKNEKKNGGVLVSRIARRAGCSLLIVPKGSEFKLNKILVPTDFSDYSKKAMEKAITLSKKAKEGSTIVVQNVYQVPVGYHYTGKSYKEFADIMKDHAAKDYAQFISTMPVKGVNIEQMYSLDKDDDIIRNIYKTAKKIKASLIVIGAKGRTAATAPFIGSKAEKLIHVDSDLPTLVVRPKGKNAGFLEYIKEL